MTELTHPKEYNGIDGLEPNETAVLGVIGLGLKQEVLRNWQRDHPDWQFPENALSNGKMRMVPMTDRLFIRMARGQGPPGSRPMDRYRPMLEGFELFNLGKNEQGVVGPMGQRSFYGFLPAGDPDNYLEINRRCQKLGKMVPKPGTRYKQFKREPGTEPAPSGHAECRGDGKLASRWMKGNDGKFGWHEIVCPNHACPFDEVCNVATRLLVYSQEEKCGESMLLRLESPTSIHTAQNVTGFFKRLKKELDSFKLSHELFGLPLRVGVEMVSKGSGPITVGGRVKQMDARRFPVLKFSEQLPVVTLRERLAARLEAGRLALPAAPLRITTPAEEVDAAADFNVEPSVKPRLELVPADHALKDDVVEAEVVEPRPAPPVHKRTVMEMVKEDFLDKGMTEQIAMGALRIAGLMVKGQQALPRNADRDAIRKCLQAVVHTAGGS